MTGPEADSATSYEKFLRTLPGGTEVVDWFGFAPSFHDATLERLVLANNSATLVLAAFRMTDKVDDRGFVVLDKHALITIALRQVSGVSLTGDAGSIVSSLTIAPVTSESRWRSVRGPAIGDFQISWESSYGLEGVLFAPEQLLSLQPQ
jgi:hypothetical protein